MKNYLLISLGIFCIYAQNSKTKVGGEVFLDYFHSVNHESKANNIDGFLFRRANISIKHSFNDDFSAYVKTETEAKSFTSENSLAFALKDAYFTYNLSKTSHIIVGLQKNPLIKRIEKFYNHRYIEKTPGDLFKFASSRVLGLSYVRSLSDDLTFHLSLANGESTKSESNKGDLLALDLNYNNKTFFADIAGQYNSGDKDSVEHKSASIAFGVKLNQFKALVSGHFLEKEDNKFSISNKRVLSGFLSYKCEAMDYFLRVDRMFTKLDKSPSYYNMKKGEKLTHFIAGFSYSLDKKVSVSPNIKLTKYDDASDKDVIYACTLFFKW